MFHDAHNHLQDDWLAPHLDRIASAWSGGVMVVNGTCEADWSRVAELARRYPWIRPSYGLHPWDAGNRTADWFATLKAYLDADPRAGVGEIGIDRWMLDRARPDDARLTGLRRAPLPEQGEVFLKQLALACSENRPVTIHCLEAWGALSEILARVNLPERGFLLHAYGGPPELVAHFAKLGAYFSFNGYFLKDLAPSPKAASPASTRLKAFQQVPLERLLVETDAPAMPLPQTWRTHKLPPAPDGSPVNHPGNLEAAYAGLAMLRSLPLAELTAQVEINFLRFFGP
ncbi:MAG: TatD family hydrolase [Verrucomicrobia bacterium]|nr:TatD family hydrolase [Verrucomicrobiota bacterium]